MEDIDVENMVVTWLLMAGWCSRGGGYPISSFVRSIRIGSCDSFVWALTWIIIHIIN